MLDFVHKMEWGKSKLPPPNLKIDFLHLKWVWTLSIEQTYIFKCKIWLSSVCFVLSYPECSRVDTSFINILKLEMISEFRFSTARALAPKIGIRPLS